VPLWKLLLDLSPEEVVATLDVSYLEDELTIDMAMAFCGNICRIGFYGRGF